MTDPDATAPDGTVPDRTAPDRPAPDGTTPSTPAYRHPERRRIGSGSTFEERFAYSRALVAGEWVFVSGTTGYDYAARTIPDGVAAQTEQAIRNIQAALAEAGSSLDDVVRVTYMLPSAADFELALPAIRAAFGDVRPAATMIECGLADPAMLIEIEVTALRS